jgi:hypothetical protein
MSTPPDVQFISNQSQVSQGCGTEDRDIPPSSAPRSALFPDPVAPLTIVNLPSGKARFNGPKRKRDGPSDSTFLPSHSNIASRNPTSVPCCEASIETSRSREHAQIGTSVSLRNSSMRCIETYARATTQRSLRDASMVRYSPYSIAMI